MPGAESGDASGNHQERHDELPQPLRRAVVAHRQIEGPVAPHRSPWAPSGAHRGTAQGARRFGRAHGAGSGAAQYGARWGHAAAQRVCGTEPESQGTSTGSTSEGNEGELGKRPGHGFGFRVAGGLAIFYESFQLLISRDRKEVGLQDAIVERPIAGLDVEDFIERHQLDERAVVQLRSLPPEELQIIVAGWQGSGEGSVGI